MTLCNQRGVIRGMNWGCSKPTWLSQADTNQHKDHGRHAADDGYPWQQRAGEKTARDRLSAGKRVAVRVRAALTHAGQVRRATRRICDQVRRQAQDNRDNTER